MKILIILDQFTDTSANKPLLDDVLFLRQQGINVQVVTLFPELPEKTLYQASMFSKATFSCLELGHLWNPKSWKKVIAHISQEKPDLVILGEGKAKMVGAVASRISHIPKIFIFSHDVETIKSSRSFLGDIFYILAHYVIVASNEAREKLVWRGVTFPSRIIVIPDGVTEVYGKRSERDIRKSLGISETDFIFIFLGDLIPEKGADVLLRAFSKVSQGCLIIIGDGAEKKNLETLSKDLGISEKVLFLPSYFDIPGLLAEAGAMIFPSKKEENISSFLPAFFSGIPVIVSDFPGVEEIIQNGVNGIVVRKQDSEELANAMSLVASDPELRASFQKNTGKGLERFSVSSHCSKILSLAEPKKKR